MATLKRTGGEFQVGHGFPTRVNALFGATSPKDAAEQLRKLEALTQADHRPDIVSDLSIARGPESKLWRRVVRETEFVSATLPIYRALPVNNRINSTELLDVALEQMEEGVGLITIHPTADKELAEASLQRMVPCTSRGGGMVIRDLLAGSTNENVYLRILPELVCAAASHGVAISLGATFRSATIFDSCDPVQLREIEKQLTLAREIGASGVGVVIETPGHSRPSDIRRIAALIRDAGTPVMPLGPIPTDAAVGRDHVAASIGATLLGMEGCAHILAAVTREEHTGGVPSIASTLEAVECARVAAHIIDLETLGSDSEDLKIATKRASSRSCVESRGGHGCSRCAELCPL